jgi:Cu/Ag efflux protein CusF
MIMKSLAVVAIAVCLTGAAVAAQQPITKSKSISGTATIQAIDATARTMTLRDASGQEETYTVGPQVKRFDEFKVGDRVKMTYDESVVVQVHQAGEKAGAMSTGAEMTAGTGQRPSGTIRMQDKMTVTVKALDLAVPSITVTTPDGRTVTRKVEDKKNLQGLKAGDQIDIIYTRALVTSIEPGK